jgi:hypothetical protein
MVAKLSLERWKIKSNWILFALNTLANAATTTTTTTTTTTSTNSILVGIKQELLKIKFADFSYKENKKIIFALLVFL